MVGSKVKGLRLLRRTPLWVAAYCFNQLKKAQLLETDVSSCVDMILQEIDEVNYRVLAYLLLGVVKIHSKKVEYLYNECNERILNIKKLSIITKDNARAETKFSAITIPDSFELDAFHLDILEDDGRGHIANPEDITLKEVPSKTDEFWQLSQGRFDDFDFGESTCSSVHLQMEEKSLDICMFSEKGKEPASLLSVEAFNESHQVDNEIIMEDLARLMNMDFLLPNSPINLLASTEITQNSIFSRKEPAKLLGQDQQSCEDQEVQETLPNEDEIHEESRIYQEKSVAICMFSEREKEPATKLSVVAFNESRQVDNELIMGQETSGSCQIQEVIEVHEARSSDESIGRPQNEKINKKDYVNDGKSSVTKESLKDLTEWSIEEHDNDKTLECQEKVSLEGGKLSVIPPKSKNPDVTPQSKFQCGSVRSPKPGASTSEFIHVSTPAAGESRFSRKRKTDFDKMTILPNEELRRWQQDASDLVQRKFCRTLLAKQREARIARLPKGFYESSFPSYSSEFRSLFSKKKFKIPDSLEIVESLDNFGTSSPDESVDKEKTLEGNDVLDPMEELNVGTSISFGSLEMEQSSSKDEDLDVTNELNAGTSISFRSLEREQCSLKDEDLDETNEMDMGTSVLFGSVERDQCSMEDDDLDLMNEETNSCETENSELSTGLSERTRKVASYLHKSFSDPRKQAAEDVVNFSQVSGGRNRKECARLFYEILVLKTKDYVDVKQDNAYGDIAVKKLPKLDQTF